MRLCDARVVLTGASGGIGQAIAAALCASGARVLAVARHREALQPLLERYPQHLFWIGADLTFLADRRKVLVAAEAQGGINLLINAAGVNHFAMLEQLDDSEINAMLALNISAPICLTKLFLPLLKQADSAMVVNVGSTYGSIGYPGYASYCASKFALRGFFRSLAPGTGRHPCRGALRGAPGHPYRDEQPGGRCAQPGAQGQRRRPANRGDRSGPRHRR